MKFLNKILILTLVSLSLSEELNKIGDNTQPKNLSMSLHDLNWNGVQLFVGDGSESKSFP